LKKAPPEMGGVFFGKLVVPTYRSALHGEVRDGAAVPVERSQPGSAILAF
jgi:hypothetical protein